MKFHRTWLIFVAVVVLQAAFGQGTFVYDQQSSIEGNDGEGLLVIQNSQPLGQSFVPSLSGIDFIRLRLLRATFGTASATVYLNLRENSINGNILSTSQAVPMSAGFVAYTNFYFPARVSLTPGVTYFFQPVVAAGDPWAVGTHNAFGYANGVAYASGQPLGVIDLWFREGIYNVPEPSAAMLGLLGVIRLACGRRRRFANP